MPASWKRKFESAVKELMRLADEANTTDLPDGFSIPEELEIQEKRLAAIRDAKAKIETRVAERHAQDMAEYEDKVIRREAKEKAIGKKAARCRAKTAGGGFQR